MLKKFLLYELTVLLISAVVLSGCGGGKSSQTSLDNPAVYVGGDYNSAACYWDAGGRHDLDGNDVVWLSFYNNQLYAVGYYANEMSCCLSIG